MQNKLTQRSQTWKLNQERTSKTYLALQNRKIPPLADAYLRGNNVSSQFEMLTYQKKVSEPEMMQGFISQEMVDKLNNGAWYGVKGKVYTLDGMKFSKESIPPMDGSKLNEVKAKDNIISFGKYDYFKYVSKAGREYYMHTGGSGGTGFGVVYTETMRGSVYDEQAWRYISFWNGMMCATGPDVPGKEYSRSEAASFLEEANVQPGFFTVNMKGSSKTFYYTKAKYSRMVESKEDYDNQYDNLTRQTHFLSAYEPGSIFKIGEREYVLSENHILDIPYGEDIYAMEWPKIPL